MRRQSRLSLDRLIEMHGQMMQIWEDLDRGFPLSERLPKTCQEDPESWAPDPFGPVYKSQHVIAYLILDYRPAMKPRRRSGWISCGLLSGTLRTMTAGPRKIARISRPEIAESSRAQAKKPLFTSQARAPTTSSASPTA